MEEKIENIETIENVSELNTEDDGALKFKLDNFEGPLDLLLHLIKIV